MHPLFELLTRELYFLAVLAGLGAGPAAFLSKRFDLPARLAMAPVLGFAVGACVFTTTLQYVSAQRTFWLLPVVAAVSVAVAVWRLRRGPAEARSGLDVGAAIQIVLVCAVVVLPTTAVLAHRDTVGPVAFYFTDMNNYVAEPDAAQNSSIGDAADLWKRTETGERVADLTLYNFAALADAGGNLDVAPLAAQANHLIGLGASDTIAAYLIVLMLMGGLGAFAAVRWATRSGTWGAAVAGGLCGGPLFVWLWFDGYQAAICALALLVPLIIVGSEALRHGRRADLALTALFLGCLFITYPLFVPLVAILTGAVLAFLLVGRVRRGDPLVAFLKPLAGRVGLMVVLAVAFNHAAFLRCIHYAGRLLRDEVPYPRVAFKLPVDVVPGWLFQVREFWYLPRLADGGFKQLVFGGLLPLGILAVIGYGVRRYRPALVLVLFAVICAAIAQYSYMSQEDCTYCAQRNLLPLAMVAAVLVGLGIWALTTSPRRVVRLAGAAAAVVLVMAVGQRLHVELERFSNGSYFLDSANREALDRLPDDDAAVHIEGFGAQAQPEKPFVYHLVNERRRGRVSVSLGANDNNSLAYLTFSNVLPPGPEFMPGYRYVLTRFAGIDSGRRVISSRDGIALERRRPGVLDVTPYSGLGSPLQRFNPKGTAWVQPQLGPLKFHVVGDARGPAFVRLTLRSDVPVSVPRQRGVTSRGGGVSPVTTICVRTRGRAPIRDAQVSLSAPVVPATPPKELFPAVQPPQNVAMTSMRGVTGRCRP